MTDQRRILGLSSPVKFTLVGMLGFAIQLLMIQVFTALTSNYLMATAVAVELTVLHNFVWHERFTWRERVATGVGGKLRRLVRFHVSNGATSIAGNLFLMRLLVEPFFRPFRAYTFALPPRACALGCILPPLCGLHEAGL